VLEVKKMYLLDDKPKFVRLKTYLSVCDPGAPLPPFVLVVFSAGPNVGLVSESNLI
jgi:hypothetical protein